MPGKKKTSLDVGYLRTATANTLASSIFSSSVQEEEQRLVHEKQPQQISIELLHNNPFQPRVAMDEESLQQLAETIESQGFQGVLIARPHPQIPGEYQLTAGHRRREAAKRAGLQTLPVIIHSWTDQEMATLAATENIQREDLSPLEEGKLFQVMIDQMGLTQVEVATAIKKDRGYVRNRLRLAQAPDDIQAFVSVKTDSMRAVIYLLEIEDPAERAPIIKQLLDRTLTTEDLPAYVEELKRQKETGATKGQAGQISGNELFTSLPVEGSTSATQTMSETEPVNRRNPEEHTIGKKRDPQIDADTNSLQRIRIAKLKTTLRYIVDYRKLFDEQGQLLTDAEYEILQQIGDIAEELLQS